MASADHRDQGAELSETPVVGLDPADGFLDQLADPNGHLAREWDLDHDKHVFEKLFKVVRPDFQGPSWDAIQSCAFDGLPVAQAASELGVSE